MEAFPEEIAEAKAFEQSIQFYAQLDAICRSALRRYESAVWDLELARQRRERPQIDELYGIIENLKHVRRASGG